MQPDHDDLHSIVEPHLPRLPRWLRWLDVIIPPKCEACGRCGEQGLCSRCVRRFLILPPPFCRVCGQPLDPLAHARPLCRDCRGKRRAFDFARSAFVFEEPLRRAIHAFKYESRPQLGAPLGALMVYVLARLPEVGQMHWDAVVPVPLHRSRRRRRGYNQSELLARQVASLLDVELETLALIRQVNTRPQVGLGRDARRRNVWRAFRIVDDSRTRGRRVLLVDDTMTTGATLDSCARALKSGGCEYVGALALARPSPERDIPLRRKATGDAPGRLDS